MTGEFFFFFSVVSQHLGWVQHLGVRRRRGKRKKKKGEGEPQEGKMKWIFSIIFFFWSLFSPCSLGMTGEFFFLLFLSTSVGFNT